MPLLHKNLHYRHQRLKTNNVGSNSGWQDHMKVCFNAQQILSALLLVCISIPFPLSSYLEYLRCPHVPEVTGVQSKPFITLQVIKDAPSLNLYLFSQKNTMMLLYSFISYSENPYRLSRTCSCGSPFFLLTNCY